MGRSRRWVTTYPCRRDICGAEYTLDGTDYGLALRCFRLIMRLNNICGCCSVQLSIDNLPDRSAGVFEGKLLAVEDF